MKNIIVRMPNWLGDVVMATPILADLKHHFPNATITAMCQVNVAPLLKQDPHLNEIFSFERPSGWIHRRQHLEIVQPLRQGDYDVGILLTNSFSSAWWFWRGYIKKRIGFSTNLRSWLLTDAVHFPKNKEKQHQIKTYKHLLTPLDIAPTNTQPELFLTNEEIETAKKFLARFDIDPKQHRIVGINPGAAFGSAKCWLPDRFVQTSQKLLEDKSVRLIYFGDGKGAPLVSSICSKLNPTVLNLAGKTTLRELMAFISLCHALLTNDSGPMHIAAALGTPLIALFGSTNEVKTGPLPQGEVIHKHVSCSPCYKRTCPIDFRCMTSITVEEVVKKLKIILNQ